MADTESNALALTESEVTAIKAKSDIDLQTLWHDTTQRAERNTVAQGVILAEFKRRLGPHGEWLAWLADNWPKSRRTAERYMRLVGVVEKEQEAEQTTSHMNATPVSHSSEALDTKPVSYKRVLQEHSTPRPARLPEPTIIDVTPSQNQQGGDGADDGAGAPDGGQPHCDTCRCFD